MDDILEDGKINSEDIYKLFNKEDEELLSDEEPSEEVEKEEPTEKEEKKEPAEDEIEIEDDEEKLNLQEVPSIEQLTKKYPDILKDFPALKSALAREDEYTKVFATVEEAKEAVERLEDFTKLETSLLSGDSETVLKAVKESDPKAYLKLVDGLFKTMRNIDSNSYDVVIGNMLRTAIATAYNSGKETQNKDLMAASAIFHKFLFNSDKLVPPQKLVVDDDNPKKNELDEERATFFKEKLDAAQSDVDDRVTRIIESNIDKFIDPKSQMTAYVREKAKDDIVKKLDEVIESDTRFKAILDKLWSEAADNNFSESSKEKIRKAFLTKAKVVLPEILRGVRNSALKGTSQRKIVKESHEEPKSTEKPRIRKDGSSEAPKKQTLESLFMSD